MKSLMNFQITVIYRIILDNVNHDTYPKFNLDIEISQILVCLFSEKMENVDQNIICIKSSLLMKYTREKIKDIKRLLKRDSKNLLENLKNLTEFEHKSDIYDKFKNESKGTHNMLLQLFDICPFFSKLNNIINPENNIRFRKLTDEFSLTYDYKVLLKYIINSSYLKNYEHSYIFQRFLEEFLIAYIYII